MAKKEKNTSVGKLVLKLFSQAEISAEQLLHLDKKLLPSLLADRTTGRNIVWGCGDYANLGAAYAEQAEMTVEALTGEHDGVVARGFQHARSEAVVDLPRADVFTPTWIGNLQNNLLDEFFFGHDHAFNSPCGQKDWRTRSKDTDRRGRVRLPEGRTWQEYVRLNRLEITCGEAPYLASRYTMEEGRIWPVARRVGLLDRKLKLVSENVANERQWLKWAYEAYRHTYGFEWRGDYLLLARENLLATFVDFYREKFRKAPAVASLLKVAQILSWNLWQMDGLTCQVLYTVPQSFWENPLFPEANAPFCRIMDWERGEEVHFITLRERRKSRKFSFEAVVGNPPYLKSTPDGLGSSTARGLQNAVTAAPVYHLFMDLSAKVGCRCAMIHPARFLHNAGKTPRSWNERIRKSDHYRLARFFPSSRDLFEGVEIKGGVALTLYDAEQTFPPIATYFTHAELSSIVSRVTEAEDFAPFSGLVYPRDLYRFAEQVYVEHPELEGRQSKGHRYDVGSTMFDLFPEILTDERPESEGEFVCLWGRQGSSRTTKWVKRAYLKTPDNLDAYKVLVAKSNGVGAIGEVLAPPVVAAPGVGHTTTFLSVGRFASEAEARACLRYVKTKFARTLLSSLKVTQDNPREVWQHVPLQDFTPQSPIQWEASLADIDRQLYDKYGLTEEDRAFIESRVKPME